MVSDGTGYLHQLVHYLDRVFLHFDLGTSYERGLGFQPIAPLLRASFPADLSLRGRRPRGRGRGAASPWAPWPSSGAGRSWRARSTASRPSA